MPLVLHDPAERAATLASARDWAHTLSVAGGQGTGVHGGVPRGNQGTGYTGVSPVGIKGRVTGCPRGIKDGNQGTGVHGGVPRGNHFISAIVVDAAWSPRYELSLDEWNHMFEMFDEIDTICEEFGLEQVLHPHVNTLIETASDVQRVLDNSGVGWCLDTGHLAIGGYDPIDMAKKYAERVRHVHLKDVNMAVAERLNAGEMTLMQGVFDGLFQNLGKGDVDIAGVLKTVKDSGFDGWYVLEQDCSIVGEAPPEGTGPVEDIKISLDFVRAQLSAA